MIDRREFLRGSAGALVIGVSRHNATWRLVSSLSRADDKPRSVSKPVVPDELDSWLSISADSKVTVYTGRIDLGTGVQTSFAQVIADELDVPFENVSIIMGDTALTPDQGKTTASCNSSRGQQPLVRAAAEARQILLKLAGEQLTVPLDRLSVEDGVVSVKGNASRKVSYGRLIAGRTFDTRLKSTDPGDDWGINLEGSAPLKTANFRYVGKSIPRVDVPEKVTGKHPYVQNVRVPGMVHGRVVRPTAIGATLVSVDDTSARNVPGLIKVVRKGNFLGVVAEREEQAIQAARKLMVTWSGGASLPDDEYDWLRQAKILKTETHNVGDVDAALSQSAKVVKRTYKIAMQNHGMIGPSCAVADVRDGQATFWSGSQWIQGNRRDLAQFLGIPPEKVHGIWVEASGSYGRLGCDDAIVDAAVLSQSVGRPVRVQWMRDDEHGWEPKSPPALIDLRAGLSPTGEVIAFDLEGWSPSHSAGEAGNAVAWRLIGGNPGHARLSGGPGPHNYEFANARISTHYVEELLRAIYMRGPGPYQTNFAVETFMDELAVATNSDPIEFRLRYLKDSDSIAVMQGLAKAVKWQPRRSPQKVSASSDVVTGQGICHGSPGRQSGVAAEVEVHLDTGKVRIRKAAIAVVCGRIINPDGLKHQLEGGFIQGLSRSLMEEVKFDRSHVTNLDWNSYPIFRFTDIPEIESLLIDQPNTDSSGMGELGSIPTAAALSNAIFDATGARLREVPFTPDRVKAALAALQS